MTAQAGDTLISELAACKSALRRQQRRLRSAIPPSQRRAAARKAAELVLRHLPGRRCRVAIYLSVRSELSTAPLCAALLRAGHQVFVPVTLREQRMRFVRLHAHTPLRRCALGLPRPAGARGQRSARELDLVLLPLLAFDRRGGRLGNGGGYYDRALARPRCGRRPKYVGYAFAIQEVLALPCEPWDVRLDAIVSERGWQRVAQG